MDLVGLAFLFSLCSNQRMRESSSPARVAAQAPSFVPVPVRARRDGWTAERQVAFIAALARTGCIGKAARAAGMSRESAYRLRRRKGAESFAAAWDSIFAARPRGTTDIDLVWHRMIGKVGGPGARIRREGEGQGEAEAPADPFLGALRRLMAERAGGDRGGRSQ